VVDLCQVFSVVPLAPNKDRLPPEVLQLVRETLAKHGTQLSTTPEALQKLTELRNLYEPYLFGLAEHFNQLMPGFVPAKKSKDNWQTTAWAKTTNGTAAAALVHDDHF
jgi:hypothetical protein